MFPPKKSKLKILHRKYSLSEKMVFMKLPVQKTGQDVSWLFKFLYTAFSTSLTVDRVLNVFC